VVASSAFEPFEPRCTSEITTVLYFFLFSKRSNI
jgi:hypothetical protein